MSKRRYRKPVTDSCRDDQERGSWLDLSGRPFDGGGKDVTGWEFINLIADAYRGTGKSPMDVYEQEGFEVPGDTTP